MKIKNQNENSCFGIIQTGPKASSYFEKSFGKEFIILIKNNDLCVLLQTIFDRLQTWFFSM